MGRGGNRQILAEATPSRSKGRPASYNPTAALQQCHVLDQPLISLEQLPDDLWRDEDVYRNFEARYGGGYDSMQLQLVDAPIELFANHILADDPVAYFNSLITADEDWQRAVEEGDEPDSDYHDAARRLAIIQAQRQAFAAGVAMTPLLVDFFNADDGPDLLDGYHRLTAHALNGATSVPVYHLVPED